MNEVQEKHRKEAEARRKVEEARRQAAAKRRRNTDGNGLPV